jgi:hypothetical protein
LAISSGGGHWVQLLRLRPAFAGCNVTYATVRQNYEDDLQGAKVAVICDGNRWSKLNLLRSAAAVLWLVVRIRPDVVVTTGAAPGYFGCVFGWCLGARIVWIDSIANAEKLSASGLSARRFTHLWLTQWSHLERESGPRYLGSVI